MGLAPGVFRISPVAPGDIGGRDGSTRTAAAADSAAAVAIA